jgi:hypothetical protein
MKYLKIKDSKYFGITNNTEQSPSREAKSRSASPEILHLLQNPKVHYCGTTTRNRVSHEKLEVAQLVKKFPIS